MVLKNQNTHNTSSPPCGRSHYWCGSVRICLWENTNKRYCHITGVAQLELVVGEHQQEVQSHYWCGSVRICLWENTNKRYSHITGVAQLELVCGRTPTRGTVTLLVWLS